MKKIILPTMLFVVLTIFPTVLGQSAYTPLIIEPVSICNYYEPVSYYAGLPSSPYRSTMINGTVHSQSQYYTTLPPMSGHPQGSYIVKSSCDPSTGDLLMGVCGAPIGYPGYGGIVAVTPSTALPYGTAFGNPVCVNSDQGSFLAYSYGMSPVVQVEDATFLTAVQNTTSTTSTITITSIYPTSQALFLAGPLPNGTTHGIVACIPSVLCTTTVTVPRQFDSLNNPVATVYQVYLQDTNFMRVLPVTVN